MLEGFQDQPGRKFNGARYFDQGIDATGLADQLRIVSNAELPLADVIFKLCFGFDRVYLGDPCFFIDFCSPRKRAVRNHHQFHSRDRFANLKCNSPAHETRSNHTDFDRILLFFPFSQGCIDDHHECLG